MANQIEFKAGSGISLSANAADKSITIATTDPAPSTSTPLALNRGGTGVTDLTANQIAGIRAATTASNTNRFVTINDVDAKVVNTMAGNETDKAPSVASLILRLEELETMADGKAFDTFVGITASTNWTVPKTGIYRITILGGGGSGGPETLPGSQGGNSNIIVSDTPYSAPGGGGGGAGFMVYGSTGGAGGIGRINGDVGYSPNTPSGTGKGGAGYSIINGPNITGGAGGDGASSTYSGGGGGSGYIFEKIMFVPQGRSITITVGAGGAGGAGNPYTYGGKPGQNGFIVANYNV